MSSILNWTGAAYASGQSASFSSIQEPWRDGGDLNSSIYPMPNTYAH